MLKISQLKTIGKYPGYIAIQFFLEEKKDALMLQQIVRALTSDNFSVGSGFGYDEDFNEVYELDYAIEPKRNELIIEFDESSRSVRYKHMVVIPAPSR